MSNNTIDSISEFLLHAGTRYQVFDMGRGLSFVDTQQFLELENGGVPCPAPRQSKAWFAIAFTQASTSTDQAKTNDYIWFISLPIDEQSRIISATRNHFLQLIVEALRANKYLEKGLPNNPYVFNPTETQRGQLAMLIACNNASTFETRCKQALTYIHAPSVMDWKILVTQDTYFCACRINSDPTLVRVLITNWSLLALQVRHTLLKALQVLELNEELQQYLFSELKTCGCANTSELIILALSSEKPNLSLQAFICEMLASKNSLNINILSILAGRYYPQFTPGILRLFFNACLALDEAKGKDGLLFADFYRDIVAIPSLKTQAIEILNAYRKGVK